MTAAKDKSLHARNIPGYRSWESMKARCDNPAATGYTEYGFLGIKYQEDWKKYANFKRDMGVRPPGMTLDRKDGTKGYSKDNCRWATPNQQLENRRPRDRNFLTVTCGGIKYKIAAIALFCGVSYKVAWSWTQRKGFKCVTPGSGILPEY